MKNKTMPSPTSTLGERVHCAATPRTQLDVRRDMTQPTSLVLRVKHGVHDVRKQVRKQHKDRDHKEDPCIMA